MTMELKTTLIERAKDSKSMDKWSVIIDGFETTYSKGIGHREGFKLPYNRVTVWDMEQFNNPKKSKTVDPTEDEILEALACDAECYESSIDIDDFAANFDPEAKPSKVIESFEACRKASLFFTQRGLKAYDFTEQGREEKKTA